MPSTDLVDDTLAKRYPGLAALEKAIQRDLHILDYPRHEWVASREASDGKPIYDVLIIGGGQSGLTAAFYLMRERVTNIMVIDENPEGLEGPWRTFARMHTLRTPKHLIGPDIGIPNLSIRSWYEAKYGDGAWDNMVFVPKHEWADYLTWYRRFLRIPVQNQVRAGAIEWLPAENCFVIPVNRPLGIDVLYARKVVLATGIDGSGKWDIPKDVRGNLAKGLYAHTREDIDFEKLRGKKIGVLGAGASAFDNASVALEHGAGEVHMFFRRKELVRVNPYRWAEFVGFLKHHGDLPDAERWRFINQILRAGQLPPADTYKRATEFPNFTMHPGTPWSKVEQVGQQARVTTPNGVFDFDYLLIGTGFRTDLSLRRELQKIHPYIRKWSDVYTPPVGEENADLGNHPYLAGDFSFLEKNPGEAPWLGGIFNFTFGCLASLGFGGASISGMKYSLPRMVGGITRQFYLEDTDRYFRALCDYNIPDF
ncbi:SidA/IucD/PvdA family monooxygenase [bacterium]|nr:SidA/IucD/PvdA family monooxygenase [bacterium]